MIHRSHPSIHLPRCGSFEFRLDLVRQQRLGRIDQEPNSQLRNQHFSSDSSDGAETRFPGNQRYPCQRGWWNSRSRVPISLVSFPSSSFLYQPRGLSCITGCHRQPGWVWQMTTAQYWQDLSGHIWPFGLLSDGRQLGKAGRSNERPRWKRMHTTSGADLG
jgi:hypothetical protein